MLAWVNAHVREDLMQCLREWMRMWERIFCGVCVSECACERGSSVVFAWVNAHVRVVFAWVNAHVREDLMQCFCEWMRMWGRIFCGVCMSECAWGRRYSIVLRNVRTCVCYSFHSSCNIVRTSDFALLSSPSPACCRLRIPVCGMTKLFPPLFSSTKLYVAVRHCQIRPSVYESYNAQQCCTRATNSSTVAMCSRYILVLRERKKPRSLILRSGLFWWLLHNLNWDSMGWFDVLTYLC